MVASRIPIRRSNLVLRESSTGSYTAKDPKSGAYFQLGDHEAFLLLYLDGKHDRQAIRTAYRKRFCQELSNEDLTTFIETAHRQGLVDLRTKGALTQSLPPGTETDGTTSTAGPAGRQSILYWRRTLFDPDRLLAWLEPGLRLFWTRTFFFLSATLIALSVFVAATNASELVHHAGRAVAWQSLAVVAITLLMITTVHEFGHGLTCKHYGGQVHQMGFLSMYFMPCLFCNVTDAWLIGDKRKRLWITAAGGYIEMCFWALAVIAWRVTMQDTFVNYLALAVVIASGFRIFFNLNPFLKLDGYYLLSDWLEIPNLRQQALDYVAAHLRWILWGAPRPARHPRRKTLLVYGVACWCFAVLTTLLMLRLFGSLLYPRVGAIGAGFVAVLVIAAAPRLFHGLTQGEVRQMFLVRHKRLFIMLALLGGGGYALATVPMEKRARGSFEVCPLTRRDVRAPIAGFIREINVEEGQHVSASAVVARLEIPDLESRIAQKDAEVREVEARLRLLEQGPRPEELEEQNKRVARAASLRDLCQRDLERAKEALEKELVGMEYRVKQVKAEVEQAKSTAMRTKKLLDQELASREVFEIQVKQIKVASAVLAQSLADKSERQTKGTAAAEQELAVREKELADEVGALKLLEAGSRDEKIEAEQAQLARLQEELRYLHQTREKLPAVCGWQGIVVTPRVKERIGQYVNEGDLICTIEEVADLKIEIELPEQELREVVRGQRVVLKARALPFDVFEAKVERIAPSARAGDVQSSVVIHTRLDEPPPMLRPGMTGYARIDCGQQPVGRVLLDRALQYVRTEFWW